MSTQVRKAFRDYQRTLLWLMIGLAAYGMMTLAFFPMLVEQREELETLLDNMPRQFIGMMYQGDLDEFDFTDPAIFFQARYVIWLVLVMGGMLTAHALHSIIGAERNGTLDLALSLPVARRDWLAARFINVAIVILAVLLMVFVVFVVGSMVVPDFDIAADDLAIATFAGFFPLMAQASIAFALASLAPSTSRWAGPIAFGYFFGTYLLNAFRGTVDLVDTISPLFVFRYYDAGQIINDGLDISNIMVLSAVIVVASVIAFQAFERKELGV